jgi:hypothetical protein
LTLSQSIEKLQYFEISFDGNKSTQNSDFLAILRYPLVAMVTGNLGLSMPLKGYGSVQFELVTEGFSMKTAIFHMQ